jgi:hypothetical protein
VVQATVGVDVNAAVEEPPQPGGVLEVQLVHDQPVEAGLVEQVQERGVRLLAGVVKRVLVLGGTALDKQPDKRKIAALDGGEQRGLAPFSARLYGVAVRVGTRIQQHPCALAHLDGRADRPPQQHQQRRQSIHRRSRRRRIGKHKT